MLRSHRFCNIHTPDDGPDCLKVLGPVTSINQPIPVGYHKVNAATKKDIHENL